MFQIFLKVDKVQIKQGRKRPLDTPKRMIKRREREGKREKERQKERYREGGRDKRVRDREGERGRKRDREIMSRARVKKGGGAHGPSLRVNPRIIRARYSE